MKSSVSIEKQVLKKISNNRRGKIFFPKDFFKIGSSQNVRQALNRLKKKEFLIRLANGIYFYPKQHETLGVLLPTLDEIAQEISKRDKARIIPTGIQALNKLGLSNQVPLNAVYLTDGSSRTIQIGNGSIKFKKASPQILSIKSEVFLLVVQGLRELGKENVDEQVMNRINNVLKNIDDNLLNHDLKKTPVWISELIKDNK